MHFRAFLIIWIVADNRAKGVSRLFIGFLLNMRQAESIRRIRAALRVRPEFDCAGEILPRLIVLLFFRRQPARFYQ